VQNASTYNFGFSAGLNQFRYYPFGMVMPGRSFVSSGGDYRFGFNGMEKDGEAWSGNASNQLDFGARIYDSRLGRFLSLDPLSKKFPSESNYNFAGNSPIVMVDKDGMEKTLYIYVTNLSGVTIKYTLVNEKEIKLKYYNSYSHGPTLYSADAEQDVFMDLRNGQISISEERFHQSDVNFFKQTFKNLLDDSGSSDGIQKFGYILQGSVPSPEWELIKGKAEITETLDISFIVNPDIKRAGFMKGLTGAIEALGEVNADLKRFMKIMDITNRVPAKAGEVINKSSEMPAEKDTLFLRMGKNNEIKSSFYKENYETKEVDTVKIQTEEDE
jgi:RHS repeat-associated protein